MARYNITHRTTYAYTYPVSVSHHAARLKPVSGELQNCESFYLDLSPACTDLVERKDYFNNVMHLFSVQESHASLVVQSRSHVFVRPGPLDLEAFKTTCGDVRAQFADRSRTDLTDIVEFLYPTELTPASPEVEAFGRRFIRDEKAIGNAVQDMLQAFRAEFEFDPTATELSTPINEVLRNRRGVCQDYAHLMIASLRACGLSARYVSGYILTHPPAGSDRLLGADASHAWVSVHVPGQGWIEVDPTNCLVCSDQHIRVAYGRDYGDVSVISGAVTGGGQHTLDVAVTVMPIDV